MEKRQQELSRFKAYTNNIEKEVTLLLQNLQWDPKLTREKHPMVTCKYDSNHKIPLDDRDLHEEQCHLTKLEYRKEDTLLPEPVDVEANTIVKFSQHEIAGIINNAAIHDPLFKRGSQEWQPLTVERLQWVYTADERRAIHDAVVNTAPFCHDLTDLDLLSPNDDANKRQKKSRLEILAELRNMKRRRTKYRVAPKTRNYSDVLRDVIKTQMDSYGETTKTVIKTEYGQNVYVSQQVSNISSENVSHGAVDELEMTSDIHFYNTNQRDGPRERHRAKSRENKYNDDRRAYRKDKYPGKERDRSYDDKQCENSKDYTEKSRGRRHDERQKSSARDKYSSRERSENYDDYQRKERSDRNREKRCNDSRSSYYSDYSSRDKSRNYESHKTYIKTEHDIKQERASQESESSTQYTRDRNGDRSKSNKERHYDSKNKHSRKERSVERQKRYSDYVTKKESTSSLKESFNNSEISRKRQRSRSKERKHKDKKRKHDKGKHSSKRDKDNDSVNIHHASEMVIKQERQSP